jgi:homoserine kinase type II
MNINVGKKSKAWVVYILRCADNSLYTGITNNMEKRFDSHNQGVASKYTRSRRPVELLITSSKMEKSIAMSLEIKIKKLPKTQKIATLGKYATKRPSTTGRKSKSLVLVEEETPLFNRKDLQTVAKRWQVNLKKLHYDIQIQGSPERSVFRVVLEDNNDKFFVLEQVDPKTFERKKQIAATLDFLEQHNLAHIQPYLASANGGHIIKYKNNFWQMVPFVQGVVLDREKYMYEGWRGPALADFLIEIYQKSRKLPFSSSYSIFSLRNYVNKLIHEINLYNKDIKTVVNDIALFLEKDFMPAHDKIPVAFCHGDYHPLNIIWSADDIKYVIDWEFCGYKSNLYDAANLIGCVGVEDPQSLTGLLVKSFITKMKASGIISKTSWKYLVEYIVALRFAWLSEWLRRNDSAMISLELDYMRLLINNKKSLQKAWL